MSTLRKILLALLIVSFLVVIILTWGSIGSIVLTFGLIMTIPAYLFNRFINSDKGSDFTDDEN